MLIYTAMFDGPEQYDSLPKVDAEKGRYVAFMDIKEPYQLNGWDCRPAVFDDESPRKRARHHKALAHCLFPDEPETLWIDSNVIMGDDLDQFRAYDADIVSMPHHRGGAENTWRDEAMRCISNKRVVGSHATVEALWKQIAQYEMNGLPENAVAPENRVLYRRNNVRTVAFDLAWWWEMDTQTIRDQVSFAWARHVSGASLALLPRHIFEQPYEGKFTAGPHHPKIYYFSPFDRRGLGWAYKSCIDIVPHPDCWICFVDMDVMLFPSSIGMFIEDVLSKYGQHYDYFTALTNRVMARQMCIDGKMSPESDLVKLYQLAMGRLEQHGDHVSPWTCDFAGYFMLFQRKLVDEFPFAPIAEVRGKPCKVLGIDTNFSHRLQAAGKKMGCIDGLTAIHYYRLAEEHAEHRAMLENPQDLTARKVEPKQESQEPKQTTVIPDKPKVAHSRSRQVVRGRA